MTPPKVVRWGPILAFLLVADLFIVLLHVMHVVGHAAPDMSTSIGRFFADPFFSLEENRGFGEAFQYLKFFAMGAALLGLAWWRREILFAAWGMVALFLFSDDLFEVHEHAGVSLGETIGGIPALGLRPGDVGQLVVVAVAAALLLTPVLWAHWRAPEPARETSRSLAVLLVLLAFFGVGVDLVHALTSAALPASFAAELFAVIEDGGELLAASAMVALVAGTIRLGAAKGARRERRAVPERPTWTPAERFHYLQARQRSA